MMDSFEKVLPKILKLQLFSEFDSSNPTDVEILKSVYDILEIKQFKKDEVIIREGETGSLFYILYSGQVLITRGTPAGDIIALATLNSEQNIFFGEMAIITNDQRSATVTANTNCSTLTISGEKFSKLCDKYPVLGYRIYSVLARRLAKTLRETNNDKAILYEALCNEIEIGV